MAPELVAARRRVGVDAAAGVRIGAEGVIGAGSLVTRDVPARTFAAGNPARVVRTMVREITE